MFNRSGAGVLALCRPSAGRPSVAPGRRRRWLLRAAGVFTLGCSWIGFAAAGDSPDPVPMPPAASSEFSADNLDGVVVSGPQPDLSDEEAPPPPPPSVSGPKQPLFPAHRISPATEPVPQAPVMPPESVQPRIEPKPVSSGFFTRRTPTASPARPAPAAQTPYATVPLQAPIQQVSGQVPMAAEPGDTPQSLPVVQNLPPMEPLGAPRVMQQPPVVPPVGQPGAEPLPPPRSLEGFGPNQVRLPRLDTSSPDACEKPDKYTPKPTEKELEEYGQYVGEIVDPKNTFDLIINRTRIMMLKEAPTKTQIGDDSIATFELLGPKQLSFVGKKAGSTVLNLWFKDPLDATKEKVLSYLIRVIPDPEAKARLDRVFKALADEINDTFPDSYVWIHLVGDKIVVSGQAKDMAEATQILRVVRANAPPEEATAHRLPIDNVQLNVSPDTLPQLRDFLLAGGPNVINLLRVPGEQQVNLRITVAEVNRTAARSIGVDWSIRNNAGTQVFAQTTGGLLGGGGGGQGGQGGTGAASVGGANLGGGGGNLPINLDNGQVRIAINALRTLNYARTLAEPNLTTLNGQPATFQAGGSFPVPVVTGFTAAGLQGISFVPFGVQLSFIPFITDRDRIRLSIQAAVSTRDVAIGSNFGGGGGGGGGGGLGGGLGGLGGQGGQGFVPGLQTRNFTTTVELREGQTLAVAGLLRNDLGADSSRVPFFGDLPIVGMLAGFSRIAHGDQELVVLVTPELVHPYEPKEVPALPGSDLFEPDDLEFYICNKMESLKAQDYNSQLRTDFWRIVNYHVCEDTFIVGPKGHVELPPPQPGHAP